MFRPTPTHRAESLGYLPLLATLLVGSLFVFIAHESLTWVILIVIAIGSGAFAFLYGDLKRLLLFLFIFTLSINLSKALILQGGIYSPGLSLFLSDISLFALALLLLGEHLFVNRVPMRSLNYIDILACLYVTWLWVSSLYSEHLLIGALSALNYTKYLLAYFIVSRQVQTYSDLKSILAAVFSAFFLQMLYLAAQTASGSPLELQGSKATHIGTQLVFDMAQGTSAFRPAGFLQHPNVMADYLTFLLPIALSFALLGQRWLPSRAWLASMLVLVAGSAMLVLTLSRGGWIAFSVAAVVIIVVGLRRGLVGQIHITLGIVGIVAGVSVISIAYPQAILRLTQSDFRSTESRLLMIDQALLIIRKNPVLGVGYGSYNSAAQIYIPESFSSVSKAFQEEIQKGIVHNYYLLVAAEVGVPATLFWLLLMTVFIRQGLPLQRWRSPPMFALAVGLMVGLVAQMVFHLFDHFYGDVRISMLWVSAALLQAMRGIEARAHPSSANTGERI